MRRADRLFEILQILRRKNVVRAADIAEALEVSRWTVYRDIRDLMVNGVPIDGEAGTGYMLRPGFDLPPLMFDEREIAALLLGARMVESWADPELAEAARNVVAKVRAVVPERQRRNLDDMTLLAPSNHFSESIAIDQIALRRSVRDRHKIRFGYSNGADRLSERYVRPLLLAFFGPIWLLPAWCELRQDFRVFRLDRMSKLQVLDEQFRSERGKTAIDFLKQDAGHKRSAAGRVTPR
jgi:predicted DNA-binding transcriptional regulator YafY